MIRLIICIAMLLMHQTSFAAKKSVKKVILGGTAAIEKPQKQIEFKPQRDQSESIAPSNQYKSVSAPTVGIRREEASPTRLRTHSLGLGVGQTFLFGDYANNGDDGITPELYYTYSASYSFDLLANFHYSKHHHSNNTVSLLGMALGLKAKLYNFDGFGPHVVGGFGFYRPQFGADNNSKIGFGYHIGIGADLKLNERFSAGVLSHFHKPFSTTNGQGPTPSGSYGKLMLMLMASL